MVSIDPPCILPDGNDDRIFDISRSANNSGVLTLAKRLDREFSGHHLLTIKCFRPYEKNVKAKRAKYDSLVSCHALGAHFQRVFRSTALRESMP
jgi:hypothetical protein